MSQIKIRNALETRLAAFSVLKGNIPVVWENIKTIPTVSFLKATVFPSPTKDPSIGDNHKRYLGIFRVTYYCTDLNSGMGDIEAFIDDLVAYFPRGLQLPVSDFVVNIESTPSTSSAAYDSNYLYISVDMYYRADVFN